MATATAAPPAVALPQDEAKGFMDDLTKGQGRADKSGALGALDLDGEEDGKNKAATRGAGPSNAGAIGGAQSYGRRPAAGAGGGGGYANNAPAAPPARAKPAADNADPWASSSPAPTTV